MTCAYGVPFHITHGAPPVGTPGNALSAAVLGVVTMMCGPATTQSLAFVGEALVAKGSVALAPRSPCSMYATATPVSFGGFLLIQAPAHFWNSASRHIGSCPTA